MWLWHIMYIKLKLVTISTELGRTATAVSYRCPSAVSPLIFLSIQSCCSTTKFQRIQDCKCVQHYGKNIFCATIKWAHEKYGYRHVFNIDTHACQQYIPRDCCNHQKIRQVNDDFGIPTAALFCEEEVILMSCLFNVYVDITPNIS